MTTVKRSSRASPRRTLFWSGALAAGLLPYTSSALTGGSRSSSNASPRRVIASTRVPGGRRSSRQSAAQFPLKKLRVSYAAPPPGWRQSPVTPGMQVMVRTAMPPPACRCIPGPIRMAVGRAVASRSPRSSMRRTGSPVISATRAGGYSRIRSRKASQPSVCASMKSRSSAPRASTTWSNPSARAASVPGRGARCSSAWSAVRVRIGSIATTCAPPRRAASMNFQMWWCVTSGFAPQRMTSRARANPSGSMPMRLSPSV